MRRIVVWVLCVAALAACEESSSGAPPWSATDDGSSAGTAVGTSTGTPGTQTGGAPTTGTAPGQNGMPAAGSAGMPEAGSGMPTVTTGSAPADAGITGMADAETTESHDASADAAVALPGDGSHRAVTADFLNQSLTVFDLDKLAPGVTRSDVVIATVDLSAYSPGAMSVGISPDGKTAIVSISAGFLGSFIDVPAGDGTLVFVDLETYEVTGELFTGAGPMGVVFSNDSTRAFVGQFSESYFAVVDVAARTFSKVSTGSSYNEELDIDDTGEVGILTYGPSGNVKTFRVDDPSGSLGQTRGLSGDAAGVAFFPATKKAYLVQAPTILTGNSGGHNVIDVTDPTAPVASDNTRMGGYPTVYPVTAVPARGSIVYPATEDGRISVVEKRLNGDVAEVVQTIEVGAAESLVYGIGATSGTRVLVASSGEHYVGVVDLETGEAFTVPWEMTESGPTEVKVIP